MLYVMDECKLPDIAVKICKKNDFTIVFRYGAGKNPIADIVLDSSRLGESICRCSFSPPTSKTRNSAPGRRSVAELEADNARLRRELAVERMEKEILKRPPRISLGNRCPVRAIKDDAIPLSYCVAVSRF